VVNLGELTKISDKLITTRSLTLNNLNITSIADDLEVGGNLTIIRCKDLIKLPDGLFVDGELGESSILQDGQASLCAFWAH
jgi:hypothetical protein